MGRVAALNWFVSRSIEQCLPFFQVLKQSKDFLQTKECQKALTDLKDYLGSAPLLGKPDPDEELYLYLMVLPVAVSAVLVQEQDKIQKLVYYIS